MAFKPATKLTVAQLKDHAARLLAGRALSLAELRRKLRARAARVEDVDEVIGMLSGYGVVDDRRLAASFAMNRAEGGMMGRGKATAQLRAKGVAATVVNAAVEQAYQGRDEVAMVERYLERKFRGKPLAELLEDRAKMAGIYRRLRTAGFGHPAVVEALKKVRREAAELEDLPEEGGE
ncbi:MAG TPA: RecX family transcriptional regulator [Bryobacteraceae bacterium]|nr:RecX family transcriptional regulator [Bryobacteraceae bacterium]HPT24770.1 RecX family transcriptional regulator [Bryobacteraceae bacterium]